MELCNILFLLLLISSSCRSLKLARVLVPSPVDIRSSVSLRCEYDLEGVRLYSVKWYKDEQEFFRFMPESPYTQAFSVPGFTVDTSRCDMHTVSLVNLNFDSSGNYRCEVSAEAPNFETTVDSANMTVMAFPVEDPVIEGILPSYSVGDFLSGNCTSPRSKPPTTLEWYINDERATNSMWEFPMNNDSLDSAGLYTKIVGLQFQVTQDHFAGRTPTMEIRCTATLGHVVRHRTLSATLVSLTNQMLSQERVSNNSATSEGWRLLSVMLACSVMLLFTS